MLAFFISHLRDNQLASSTICTYVTAVGFVNQLSGHPNPVDSFIVKKMLASVKRGTSRDDQRLPVTPFILSKIIHALQHTADSHYQKSMLAAMFLLAFHAFLRIGEICQNRENSNVLQLQDIQFLQNVQKQLSHLEITFRSFKSNYNIRPVILSLRANSQDAEACPVHSLYQFIQLRGTCSGPLFCFPPNLPVTCAHFCSCFNQALAWPGLPTSRFKSHSFRIGAASTAAAQGVPDEGIQHMGRWKSMAFKRYIRLPTMYITR